MSGIPGVSGGSDAARNRRVGGGWFWPARVVPSFRCRCSIAHRKGFGGERLARGALRISPIAVGQRIAVEPVGADHLRMLRARPEKRGTEYQPARPEIPRWRPDSI